MHIHIKYGDMFRINITYLSDDKLIELYIKKNNTQTSTEVSIDILVNNLLLLLGSNVEDLHVTFFQIDELLVIDKLLTMIFANLNCTVLLNYINNVTVITEISYVLSNILNNVRVQNELSCVIPSYNSITVKYPDVNHSDETLYLIKHKLTTYKKLNLHNTLIYQIKNKSYKNIKKEIKKIFNEDLSNNTIRRLLSIIDL